MRANSVSVDISIKDSTIEIPYQIDKEFNDVISFKFPFSILPVIDQNFISVMGLWMGAFLGQLCLAKEIKLNFPIFEEMVENLVPVIESMYDVRCYRDNFPLFDFPVITANVLPKQVSNNKMTQTNKAKKVVALWSGGKDSTLGIQLLLKNGYDVIPLYFNANVDTEVVEKDAVKVLAKLMGLTFQNVEINFPDFIPIAIKYSDAIHRRPFDNSNPHGRELLLLGPTILFARKFGATDICIAHDHESWVAKVSYQGKSILRWDTSSEEITISINDFIEKYLGNPTTIFSPIASISDYKAFELMLLNSPQLLKETSCCHFGGWCGECTKCVRYYLYQRVLGKNLLSFEHDPVKEQNWYLKKYVDDWQNQVLSYWADIHYCLYQIVIGSNDENLETILLHYKHNVLPKIEKEMPTIEKMVMEVYPDKMLPQDWVHM